MEYRISELSEGTVIHVSGHLNRNAIYWVSTFLKPLIKGGSPKIMLDIDGLEDERDMIFHVGLVNAFKKEIDQAGGCLTIKTERPSLRNYLKMTGIERIFPLVAD